VHTCSLERGQRLVEGRARETEGRGARGDGDAIDARPTAHLVLNLDEIARVEELVADEHGVRDAVGAWVEAALRAQGDGLRVGELAASH
jgi:hypothetical protein